MLQDSAMAAGDQEGEGASSLKGELPPEGVPLFLSGLPAPPDKPGFVYVHAPDMPGKHYLVSAETVAWE